MRTFNGRAALAPDAGMVVESDFDEGDGHLVTRYNAQHYAVSETLAGGTPYAVVFSYHRDVVSNVLTGTTLSCAGPAGQVTRTLSLDSTSDRAKYAAVRETCNLPPGR